MLKWRRSKKRKIWYFDIIGEAHNHKLQPSARMVRYMHAHKQREAAMDDLFAIMLRSGVPTRLRWMWCQNCMEDVKTGHSQRRTSKTCKSYARWQSHTWLFWLFGIWLQAWVVCDCKNNRIVCDCKNYFLCVTLQKLLVISVTAKEKKNWTSVWLQLFCVRDCNKKLSVVANPDCVYVVVIYLVIWYMIASLGSVWLQKLFFVCDCKNCWLFLWLQKKKRTEPVCDCNCFACVIATRSYLWLQTLTVSVWL
jgi:hypothetical protein